MIVTTIEKITDYKDIPYAEDIVKFVREFKNSDMKTGRYDIHGDDLFAAVSVYDTEPEADRKFENHKKYIDLQILVKGTEEIHWAPVEKLSMTSEEFSKGGDIAFYDGDSCGNVLLNGDNCAILFENDAHKPNVMHKTSENVVKIVFKIKNNA
ncbi:MAG: YhcH/YjgK/YiaL family protein [Clostridia bacterium]|nr:YhcH/YjgK/YiaL family protein [Clostridia bacterium]